MKISQFLFTVASLSLGGCLSISTGCGESHERVVTVPAQVHAVQLTPVAWPPANVVLDPNSIYVTGIGRNFPFDDRQGRSEALQNALEQARRMGVKEPVLTEVCEDPGRNHGTRILYRVIPAPK